MAQQLEHLKWIQGTTFMVDGFRFQNPRCTKYFLTHFHADHTTGGLTAAPATAPATAPAPPSGTALRTVSERYLTSPSLWLLVLHAR